MARRLSGSTSCWWNAVSTTPQSPSGSALWTSVASVVRAQSEMGTLQTADYIMRGIDHYQPTQGFSDPGETGDYGSVGHVVMQ